MLHRIYKLSFDTPVRFGPESGGSDMNSVRMTAHADTLFSALFLSMMQCEKQNGFLNAAQTGKLRFSDLLPYSGERLFVPRPVGIYGKPVKTEDPSVRKLLKRIEYIPVKALLNYLQGEINVDDFQVTFGHSFERTRAFKRDEDQTLPYTVAGFEFLPECGLYTVVSAEDDDAMSFFDEAINLLSYCGIGGKISSGWGKFTYTVTEPENEFAAMLNACAAPVQMLISTALPDENEAKNVINENTRYILCRRGGFMNGVSAPVTKKRSVYVMTPGSTFDTRFNGQLMEVGNGAPHPVWRYAMGMFLGVTV